MAVKAFLLYAMQFAHSHLGHFPMQEPPRVVIVDNQVVMGDICDTPGAYACYNPENRTIYFPKTCDKEITLECKSALIHEVTHYLDDLDGGFDPSCPNSGEKEAYGNEDIFLKQHGSSLKKMGYSEAWLTLLTECPGEE